MGIKVFKQNFQKIIIYLREKIFLKKYILFYINWVKQAYNKFELNEDHLISNKQIQRYIQKLSHTHPRSGCIIAHSRAGRSIRNFT